MNTLPSRLLQDQDYKNWIKAGLCLALVKEGLEDFADMKSKEFHRHVLATAANVNISTSGCTVCHTENISFSRTSGRISCHHPFCQAFIDAIIQEGLDPNQGFTISRSNLTNTNVELWVSDPWELAKLFMHPGQGPTQTSPRETSLSGVLSFLERCQIPRRDILNTHYIEMVRRARNSIMHTADMRLSKTDFMMFTQSMVDLLTDTKVLAGLSSAQNAVSNILKIREPAFQIEPEDETKDLDHLVATLKTDIEYIKTDSSSMQQHDNDTRDKKTLEDLLIEDLLKQLHGIQDITARVAFTLLGLVKRGTESEDETVRKIGSEAEKLHSTIEEARVELWYQSRNIQRQLDELETKQTDTGAQRDTLEEPTSDDKLGNMKLIKHPTEGEKVPTGRAESPKEVALDVSVTTDEKPKPLEEEVSFEIEETIDETPKTEEIFFDIRKPAFQIEPEDETKDLDHLVATLKTDLEYIKTDSSSMQQHDNETRDKKTLEDLLKQLHGIQDITARVAFAVLSLAKRVTESKDETVSKIGSEAEKLHSSLEKAREELWNQSRDIQRQLDELETKQTDTGAQRDTLEEPASDDKLGNFKLIKHPTEGEKGRGRDSTELVTGACNTEYLTKLVRRNEEILVNAQCIRDYISETGRESNEVHLYLQWLERRVVSFLTENNVSNIVRVWAGYEYGKDDIDSGKTEPIFVVIVEEKQNDFPKDFHTFRFKQTQYGEFSTNEAKHVADLEEEIDFSPEEISRLQKSLSDHSQSLMEGHSNLLMVSASQFKSQKYSTPSQSIRKQTCIVLYVHVKGIIPFGEKPFPLNVDEFPVDVREDLFEEFKKPTEYFENLAMGCRFSSHYKQHGTIGGFVRLKSRNIGCITCCHIFRCNETKTYFEDDEPEKTSMEHGVYQPTRENRRGFGQVIKYVNNQKFQNQITVDAVLMEITDEQRLPKDGNFPDTECVLFRADLAVVVNDSTSVQRENYNLVLQFIQKIAQTFTIGPDALQISLLSFTNTTKNQFYFNTHDDKDSLIEEIGKIPFRGGGADVANALKETYEKHFQDLSNGTRDDVAKVLLLITNGKSVGTEQIVRTITNAGIKIFCIGIKPDADLQEMAKIVANTDQMFEASSFSELETMRDTVITKLLEDMPRHFNSGEIIKSWNHLEQEQTREIKVMKYGAKTERRFAKLNLLYNAVRGIKTSLKGVGTLYGQIEIKGKGFGTNGDSGALVFLVTCTGLRALGLLVGGSNQSNRVYVTPIWAVLDMLGLPPKLMSFDGSLLQENLTVDEAKRLENIEDKVAALNTGLMMVQEKITSMEINIQTSTTENRASFAELLKHVRKPSN